MNKRERSAELVSGLASMFQCPVCAGAMNVVQRKSLVCSQNHTFDFAKQGYLNLLTRPANSPYDKELFEARHRTIMETQLYAPLHDALSRWIEEFAQGWDSPVRIADLGCGEGSHLASVIGGRNVIGVGLDISKEGILAAAKRYSDFIWLVGDLAKLPFRDGTFHVLLNMLSPANYKEFRRVVMPGGVVLKVVPRSDYLQELREAFFDAQDKKEYHNEDTVSLFAEHFSEMNLHTFRYTIELSAEALAPLVQMTPLSWSADQGRVEAFLQQGPLEITVDLDLLIGKTE